MRRKLIVNFFKDRLNILGIFVLNTAILILFFNVAPGTKKEILYPIELSSFMFGILIITEWFKYYRFNYNLLKAEFNFTHELQPVTYEQKEISKIKRKTYKKYLSEISQIHNHNKERNYFISQWIHILKTPISIIDLLVQKYNVENKDPYETLENIRLENNRLYNNIEQILTIIRLEDFQKDYEPEIINLVDSIKKILNERKKQFIYSNVFPIIGYKDDNMLVYSDKKWNELMVDQVISNAIKYSHEEGKCKHIYIDIYEENENVILQIRDEGIGMPQYDVDRAFEAFFTGENGRKYRNSTGIGLYICSEIAKSLNHNINISSEINKGTKVTFKYITKL